MSDETRAIRLEDRGVLAIAGADARSFLQGLITNDIDRVSPETAIYAALLTPQGKYLFDFFIAQLDDTLLLDVEADRAADLMQRLTMYKLRAAATIEDWSDRFDVWAVLGEPAGLPALPDAGNADAWQGGVLLRDPRLPGLGLRALMPAGTSPDLPAGAMADYDAIRLAHGVPDGSRDIEVDKSFILEANADALNGVDFDKGCYVGQELTARMHHRGKLKKRLLPVAVDGPLPAVDTPVLDDGGKQAGTIRSAAGDRAIALMRLEHVDGDTPLTAGSARVTPQWPAWLARD